jgi:hypothetical protein
METQVVNFRTTLVRRARIKKAAEDAGLTMGQWINAAVEHCLDLPVVKQSVTFRPERVDPLPIAQAAEVDW